MVARGAVDDSYLRPRGDHVERRTQLGERAKQQEGRTSYLVDHLLGRSGSVRTRSVRIQAVRHYIEAVFAWIGENPALFGWIAFIGIITLAIGLLGGYGGKRD